MKTTTIFWEVIQCNVILINILEELAASSPVQKSEPGVRKLSRVM
jgi:hypothetical protein